MTKPRDPDLIRRELIEAALASYTTGGTFSLREVAGLAGVNHAQIKHMFGGKDGLKRAMLEHIGEDLLAGIRAKQPASVEALFEAAATTQLEDGGRFARALARHFLESPDAVAQERFPVVSELMATLEQLPEADRPRAKLILAERLALALGWALFAPWIRKATQLEEGLAQELESRIATAPDDGAPNDTAPDDTISEEQAPGKGAR